MPRRRRTDTLSADEATELFQRALHLRTAIIQAYARLSPYADEYRDLESAREALDGALATVAGRKLDYRKADLGLLE
ncbi:hypothetical protein BSQ44_05775 [Aquibium oceanicum]|uniref:Uncharacterized protein n=1 Tax=Aquibium oceanicum TaxID=1670800 RepID=A0A1L3SNL8_9HYPH|nr:hypothetical protein BSQ44_05775 [Aquibium oceanicum]